MLRENFDIAVGDYINIYRPNYTGIQNIEQHAEPHNLAHIDIITSGETELVIDNKKYIVKENEILCIPKNVQYYCSVKNSEYSYYSFNFPYTTGCEDTSLPFPYVFKPENPKYYLDKFKHAYNLSLTETFGYKIKIRELLYDILARMCEETSKKIGISNGSYSIRKSIDYMRNNYTNPNITLPEIAQISDVTDTHFRRVFKKVYGDTPTTHINKLRINKAKSLLKNTNMSIEKVSYECGYNNYSYFSRVFLKITGTSPTQYRTSNKNSI